MRKPYPVWRKSGGLDEQMKQLSEKPDTSKTTVCSCHHRNYAFHCHTSLVLPKKKKMKKKKGERGGRKYSNY